MFTENNLLLLSRERQERSVVGSGDEVIAESSALEKNSVSWRARLIESHPNCNWISYNSEARQQILVQVELYPVRTDLNCSEKIKKEQINIELRDCGSPLHPLEGGIQCGCGKGFGC